MNIKLFASLFFLIFLETSMAESEDVRVKLCGREFVRTVVASCGSFRVKRSMPDSDLHFAYPYRNLQNWLDRDLVVHQRGSPAVEDEQWREQDTPESVRGHPDPRQHTSPPAEPLDHSTTMQDLSVSSRSRRDAGPAGVCCTSGCTMNELIQYC
ncbi:insulin-like 3 (Leydig cell) [Danio aesculapii]|uniref:insulin-like 3 (Leydig cell) n=1 Tax=Danio aesculapii TaxID=1142201 RepID=UPI0024C04153|nr:insulin-like 3 (Leydig cell) [Danio aesculapii]